MKLIHRFHKMESESNLFDLGRDQDLPLWDIIRYSVYVKYYYPEKDRQKLAIDLKHDLKSYLIILFKLIEFVFCVFKSAKKTIVLTASRYKNEQGEYYDKSATPFIRTLKDECLVIEPIFGKKLAYSYLYDFSNLLRRFSTDYTLSIEVYEFIKKFLEKEFGECLISKDEIELQLKNFKSDSKYFLKLFRFLKIKKVIICTGNPKATIYAAKKLKIESFLVQHAGIEIDEVDYSYPSNIQPNSNVLFADIALTFGDYWCKNLNVPAKEIVVIGNDYFFNKPTVQRDESILVASTIVHGGELSKMTLAFVEKNPNLKIVYKLHPNEFHLKQDYIKCFQNYQNVEIVSTEVDTNILIAKSRLVVLIVSAVLYEALNQNKKVAVLKKINYERQLHLDYLKNVFFFDTIDELNLILKEKTSLNSMNFYKKTDTELIKKLFL